MGLGRNALQAACMHGKIYGQSGFMTELFLDPGLTLKIQALQSYTIDFNLYAA